MTSLSVTPCKWTPPSVARWAYLSDPGSSKGGVRPWSKSAWMGVACGGRKPELNWCAPDAICIDRARPVAPLLGRWLLCDRADRLSTEIGAAGRQHRGSCLEPRRVPDRASTRQRARTCVGIVRMGGSPFGSRFVTRRILQGRP